MPTKGTIRVKPKVARHLAALLLAFGVSYYGTLFYPDLVPAKLLLGAAPPPTLALVNGLIYGLLGLLAVGVIYRDR